MKTLLALFAAILWLTGGAVAQPVTDAAAPKFTPKHPDEFRFKGGDLSDFVGAVRDAFGVDLRAIGTVPESMLYSVQVPKMRMGREGARLDFRNVLNLYNQISTDEGGRMGSWIIKGNYDQEPDAIVLVRRGTGESSFAVKAFAMPTRSKEKTEELYRQLEQIIFVQRHRLIERPHPGITAADLEGTLQYHEEAGIIVATGGKSYVEMVTTIVEALKERAEMKVF